MRGDGHLYGWIYPSVWLITSKFIFSASRYVCIQIHINTYICILYIIYTVTISLEREFYKQITTDWNFLCNQVGYREVGRGSYSSGYYSYSISLWPFNEELITLFFPRLHISHVRLFTHTWHYFLPEERQKIIKPSQQKGSLTS